MVVGLSRQHHTYDLVETGRVFCLHLLDEAHLDWVWHFGLQSGRDVDKFQGLAVRAGKTGCPVLTDAPAWLECQVADRLNTGDRSLFLGDVVDAGQGKPGPLLTLKGLARLGPADKLRQLQEHIARDRDADARAIQEWRKIYDHRT